MNVYTVLAGVLVGSGAGIGLLQSAQWMIRRRSVDFPIRTRTCILATCGTVGVGAYIGVYALTAEPWVAWPLILLAIILLPAALVDLKLHRIPNEWMALGAVLGVTGATVIHGVPSGLAMSVLPAVGVGVGLLGISWATATVLDEPGFGIGDVKLGAVLACAIGWEALWVLYLATVLAAITGTGGRLTGRLDRRARLPFAPFVAVAAACSHIVPFHTFATACLDWMDHW